MPFHARTGYEFNESGIAAYAPHARGVYGIYNGSHYIYVDEAVDIKTLLLAHLSRHSQQSAGILARSPAYFVFERCEPGVRLLRKAQLIGEHSPCCNLDASDPLTIASVAEPA